MNSVAVMQPYFIPYLGYFQLMHACDIFLFHDDAQYVKQSWINRNRLFVGQQIDYYTIPVKSHSHTARINEIVLSENHSKHVTGLLRKFDQAYIKAPFFEETREIFEAALKVDCSTLSGYVAGGLGYLANKLEIPRISKLTSQSDIDKNLKGQQKVLGLVDSVGGDTYINLPGGRTLYHSSDFAFRGLKLRFINPHLPARYESATSSMSRLSIIDTLAHYGVERTITLVSDYGISD